MAFNSVTLGANVGTMLPQMPIGVKKHHGLSLQGQYPKRPQGGNVISQVCLTLVASSISACIYAVISVFQSFKFFCLYLDLCILSSKFFPSFISHVIALTGHH